jgi:hypothetical protein
MRKACLSVWAGLVALVTAAAGCGQAAGGELAPDDFVVVSGPASPRVAYALARTDKELRVVVDVAAFAPDGTGTSVELGLAAAAKLILADKDAQVRRQDAAARYTFTVPAARLVKADDDWRKLRMALAVRWSGGAAGQNRQRERFRHLDGASPHAGLSPSPDDWAPLDLEDHESAVADRKDRIALPFSQPMDGKATVVIEDAAGRRVRNLLAGAAAAKGPHRVEWDGLDDDGRLVEPGQYRWRSAHHGGIVPKYLMSFCNGDERFLSPFGTNHGVFCDAAANDKYVFFASAITEGGYALIALDHAGNWRQGYTAILGTGIYRAAIAADAKFLYVAHDGPAWGQHVDRKAPDWRAKVQVTLTRFDIESGKPADLPGGKRFAVVEPYEWGPGAAGPCKKELSLGGMAMLAGKLYLASRNAQAVLVADGQTGQKLDAIPLPSPGALAVRGGKLLAV